MASNYDKWNHWNFPMKKKSRLELIKTVENGEFSIVIYDREHSSICICEFCLQKCWWWKVGENLWKSRSVLILLQSNFHHFTYTLKYFNRWRSKNNHFLITVLVSGLWSSPESMKMSENIPMQMMSRDTRTHPIRSRILFLAHSVLICCICQCYRVFSVARIVNKALRSVFGWCFVAQSSEREKKKYFPIHTFSSATSNRLEGLSQIKFKFFFLSLQIPVCLWNKDTPIIDHWIFQL